jgi:hypothetical protein
MKAVVVLLVCLVVVLVSVQAAPQRTLYFCTSQCNLVGGKPSCGNGSPPISRTVETSVCYPGPGYVPTGGKKFASYSALPVNGSTTNYAVFFYSADNCDPRFQMATTATCAVGKCCRGDFMIPPSPNDWVGDIGFMFVEA